MYILFSKRTFLLTFIIVTLLLVNARSSIVSSTASKMADNLAYTILNSDDPDTVADGAPAYLLLMDSFLIDSADDPELLQSAAVLYSAYAGVFVKKAERAERMSTKALTYAQQALCLNNISACNLQTMPFEQFSAQVDSMTAKTINDWYIFGTTWAGWIKANSASVAAIAQLPKITLIMEKVIQIDEHWDNEQAHLYMGILSTLLPPALGGKPEKGRQHFEMVINASNGKNLMAKVLLAQKYARLIFDQKLHDTLLQQVLDADPYAENMTLMNTLAQQQAQELLDSSADYF